MIEWNSTNGGVAQSGEHLLCKQGVRGSNPLTSTIVPFVWFQKSASCPRFVCVLATCRLVSPLKFDYNGIHSVGKNVGKSCMSILTSAKVKSVTQPGRHGDGDGLYLNVSAGGTKSWVQRIVVDSRRRDIGLGSYPSVSLSKARELAAANRSLVAEGKDPLLEKRRSPIPTFREAAIKVHEANLPRWRNEKHAVSWLQTLERHAFPSIGSIPVDRIGREDVLSVLTPIWGTRQETARRVRQRIRTVLKWCMAHGFVEVNLAGETIDGALPPMPKIKAHFRSLPYRDVPKALTKLENSKASASVRLCMKFLILTATRSGEVRGANWSEVDLEDSLWTIPAERMKGGTVHRVPLSGDAVRVLTEAECLKDDSGLIFPSPNRAGSQLSDMTLTKLLRDNGIADRATVHGFRSSFRDWASESTNATHAAMELSLAHSVGSAVEAAYARSDLLSQRRRLMEQWAVFLATGGWTADDIRRVHGAPYG